ncbi:GTP pyrophosphokinase family protein [Nocardioides sp. MJB4]|uniref:GTP pyrophosphokinase family protein n=2 Tax=Nocardioides donggukensis TaxID=2774019 RepID=A0A927K5F4_9ACTN|nr:GTP pyrophosphokinase family protein [Nocardioides donggukensis]
MMQYKFGIDEVATKISILQEEFAHLHSYNPIEHVQSRLKSPESIMEKVARRGCGPTFEEIRSEITDIAGVRVTCSFVSDVYRVYEMLADQPDLTVRQVKDYVAQPKPNGYRSLHALVEVPVHLSDRIVPVVIEVQLRTVAMDFWASLEHKIYYKFDAAVPQEMVDELREAAHTAADLDHRMEVLHRQLHGDAAAPRDPASSVLVPDDRVVALLHSMRAQDETR